ncbi:MAG TPA: PfkB family carbohydrate kinase [Candidatus Limnocylindrales bacterium]|nr:PfkB family carbohydrate kinase [Candidatus Limnocylindrales bacterium]
MVSGPRPSGSDAVDLLVVGGLTIDRFADGSTAPGGSVLHAARALHLDGRRTAIATLAGDEPPARAGIAELGEIADVRVQAADRTITFEHREVGGRRELTFGGSAGTLDLRQLPQAPRAVLYASIADELDAALGGQAYAGVTTGAILQGWLRDLRPGEPVDQRALAALDGRLLDALAGCNLLVASVDDLAREATSPDAQLAALRGAFGQRPIIALTAGLDGAWLGLPGGEVRRLMVTHRVEGVSTVGAGDAFAAAMLAALSRGDAPVDAAQDAANLVAELLAERSDRQLYVTGDVHGMLGELRAALRLAGLIDASGSWAGGRDELWLTGDLADRGPDGIGVIELVMRLQREAPAAGGRVGCVLGNHEVQLLAAHDIPGASTSGFGGTFEANWEANGGRATDLARLNDEQVAWLRTLPVAARIGPALVVHSDSARYPELGRSVAAANAAVAVLLAKPRPAAWDGLLADLAERRAFARDPAAAARLLAAWGGREVVHGHTPVTRLFDDAPGHPPGSEPGGAVRYAAGRAVAVDGGVYAGGDVILHRVPRYDAIRA